MKKAILFGLGRRYQKYRNLLHKMYNVVGVSDNNYAKNNKFCENEHIFINPDDIKGIDYDVIVVVPAWKHAHEILLQLYDELLIPVEKIEIIGINSGSPFAPVAIDEYKIVPIFKDGVLCIDCGIKMNMKSRSDIVVFQSVFCSRSYNIALTDDEFIAIDIGMNIGAATLFFATYNNIKHVYAYELVPTTYADALENFALNPALRSKISAYPFGLGIAQQEVLLKKDGDSIANNMCNLAENESDGINCNIEPVDVVLTPIINEHYGKRKIILKIDCEGSEYEILEKLLDSGLLGKIDIIIFEWHASYQGTNELDYIDLVQSFSKKLTDDGFVVFFQHAKFGDNYAFGEGNAIRIRGGYNGLRSK